MISLKEFDLEYITGKPQWITIMVAVYNCSQMQKLHYKNGSENGSLPGRNKQSPQNRWTNPWTDKLVELYIFFIESWRSHETWLKIRAENNKLAKKKRCYNAETKFVTWRTFIKMWKKIMRKQEVLRRSHSTSMILTRFLVEDLLWTCRR